MKQLIKEINEALPENLKPTFKMALEDLAYYKERYEQTQNQQHLNDINRCTRIIEDLNEIIAENKLKELIYQLSQISGIILKGVIVGLLM
jgi:flagellin-specific chaperone FliS